MNVNYQLELDKTIDEIQSAGKTPRLLLHCCCAPCSSYVLEYLSSYFEITVFFYNPNIYPAEEFDKRTAELSQLIEKMSLVNPVSFVGCHYSPEEFYDAVKGYEDVPEGGKRCEMCFNLRLAKTAEYARENGYDYFTTTLSISPLKNSQLLNETGKSAAAKYGVKYLFSDFKKRNGYKRSCELSQQYGLYRQDYCGCIFSLKESEKRRAKAGQ